MSKNLPFSPPRNYIAGGVLATVFEAQSINSLDNDNMGDGRGNQSVLPPTITVGPIGDFIIGQGQGGGGSTGTETQNQTHDSGTSSYQRFHYDLVHETSTQQRQQGQTQNSQQNQNLLTHSISEPTIESQNSVKIKEIGGEELKKSLSSGIISDEIRPSNFSRVQSQVQVQVGQKVGQKAGQKAGQKVEQREGQKEGQKEGEREDDEMEKKGVENLLSSSPPILSPSPDKPISQSYFFRPRNTPAPVRSPPRTRSRSRELEGMPSYRAPTLSENIKARAKKEAKLQRQTVGSSPIKRRSNRALVGGIGGGKRRIESDEVDPWAVKVIEGGRKGVELDDGNKIFNEKGEKGGQEEGEVEGGQGFEEDGEGGVLDPPPAAQSPIKRKKRIITFSSDGDEEERDEEDEDGERTRRVGQHMTPRSAPIFTRILATPSSSHQDSSPPPPMMTSDNGQLIEMEETQYSQTQLIPESQGGGMAIGGFVGAMALGATTGYYKIRHIGRDDGSASQSQSQIEATQINEESANAPPGISVFEIIQSRSSMAKTTGHVSPATVSPVETRQSLQKKLGTIREERLSQDSQDVENLDKKPFRDNEFFSRQRGKSREERAAYITTREKEKQIQMPILSSGTVIPDSQEKMDVEGDVNMNEDGEEIEEETLKKRRHGTIKEPQSPSRKRTLIQTSSEPVVEQIHPQKKTKLSHPVIPPPPPAREEDASFVGIVGNDTHTSTSTSQPSQIPGGNPPFTHVFVFLKDRRIFVSGRILAVTQSSVTVEHFSTSHSTPSPADYAFDALRKLELQPGDHLNVNGEKVEIADVQGMEPTVALDKDTLIWVRIQGELDYISIKVSDIVLHAPRRGKCSERQLDAENLERLKLSSLGPRFYRCAFLLTYPSEGKSPTQSTRGSQKLWVSEKSLVEETIKSLGGSLIASLEDVVDIDQELCVCEFADTSIGRRMDIKNIFVLADRPCTTQKYLVALAVGIPCVSTQWVLDSHGGRNWKQYAIGAGHSITLDTYSLGRQYKLIERKESYFGVKELHEYHVGFMIFKDRNIVVVGEKPANEGSQQLLTLLIAMGAIKAEYVTGVNFKRFNTSSFDWIIQDDSAISGNGLGGGRKKKVPDIKMTPEQQAKCYNVSWVKECLITGRVLPNHRL